MLNSKNEAWFQPGQAGAKRMHNIDIDCEIGERAFRIDIYKMMDMNAKNEHSYHSNPSKLKKRIEQWLGVCGEDACFNSSHPPEESLGRALIEQFDLERCEVWNGEYGVFTVKTQRRKIKRCPTKLGSLIGR